MNEITAKECEINTTLQKAISSSTNSKAARLKDFNKICEQLVNKAVPLRIALIVKYMMENGHQMSNQSIYNKQNGSNPYRKLFDLWCEYYELKQSNSKPVTKIKKSQDDLIDENDLKLIDDPALRYRISLMLGELRGLKKQNDLMKQMREMSFIQSVPEYLTDSGVMYTAKLDKYEASILMEFINSNSQITFNDEGALISNLPIRKGQILSSHGLKNALLKIMDANKTRDT